uniref:Uncharacterized protein n=1 Tax=Anguilla anguilla TaxID=7936 RepID=A0A0E9T5A6_ANGAN
MLGFLCIAFGLIIYSQVGYIYKFHNNISTRKSIKT